MNISLHQFIGAFKQQGIDLSAEEICDAFWLLRCGLLKDEESGIDGNQLPDSKQ